MSSLRLGTRGSKLALWQAAHVSRALQEAVPGIEVEIIVIKTKGDKILDVALSRIGDKGLFTKEIEQALLDKEIDLAVHSMKDVPSELAAGLCLGAVTTRENPQDVLLSHRRLSFDQLPEKAVIGTSSLRRIAQVRARRPDIVVVDVRGNVDTRIRKMQQEGMEGIVLAYAGVKRLGYEDWISDYLPCEWMLPAVGQGALAIEVREQDAATRQLVSLINDRTTFQATRAERAFLRELEGGCQVPVAALARVEEDRLTLKGLVSSLDGSTVFKADCSCHPEQAEQAGKDLAQRLITQGAARILEEIKQSGRDDG